MKGYLVWTAVVSLWLFSALAFGWKMPALGGAGVGGAAGARSSGGYFPHSSWSFGK
jgi:hypothetical protein